MCWKNIYNIPGTTHGPGHDLEHLRPDLPLWDVLQGLRGTDPNTRSLMRLTQSTRQRELDHTDHTDHTDHHTDHTSILPWKIYQVDP